MRQNEIFLIAIENQLHHLLWDVKAQPTPTPPHKAITNQETPSFIAPTGLK
jgi:hypothetical protein